MRSPILLPTLLSPLFITQAFTTTPPTRSPSHLTETITSFPNGTWLENIHTTAYNDLLVSIIGSPELHVIDPSTGTQELVAKFEGRNSVFGITEYEHDTFAVIVGNYSQQTGGIPGTWEVWSISLPPHAVFQTPNAADPASKLSNDRKSSKAKPRVKKIAAVPGPRLLNGLTTLSPSTLLIADSAGSLLALDIPSGTASTVLQDETTSFDPEKAQLRIGINGVKVHKTAGGHTAWVYYSNTFLDAVYRIRVPVSGPIPSHITPELVAKGDDLGIPDDLAVGEDGKSLYVARPLGNTIERVNVKSGSVEAVVSGEEVEGATSVSLGKGKGKGWTYVSTNVGRVVGVKLE